MISILVTVAEVGIRFSMLSKAKGDGIHPAISVVGQAGDYIQLPPSDLELLAQTLGLEANASFDDVRREASVLRKLSLAEDGLLETAS